MPKSFLHAKFSKVKISFWYYAYCYMWKYEEAKIEQKQFWSGDKNN